ncbi:LOW QUALITY PROTEIN: pre T-cell antigen receptor alpha [Tamandua tetradactyla]|uniref:LOW QUALITY PROTEIN: pre T-cell antigen receptor alpha n=1 Tax=Tamandua tetradactyla TaxID=48850 RepID=UPI0040546FC6
MAGPWLLLLLALGCSALPTDPIFFLSFPEISTFPSLAHYGIIATPFPFLAPPITFLVDGKQQTLVVCLVLDVAPSGLDSPIWFSAGNGSLLDAFTYGPSPAADGTWTSLAQLSLPSKEVAAWEPLVCHTGPGADGLGWSTQPLQLSGDASSARTCIQEPLRGMPSWALRLAALRLLLFKLLLFDVLLTCSRVRALRAPAEAPPPGGPAPHVPQGSADRPPVPPAASAGLRTLSRRRLDFTTLTEGPRCGPGTGFRVHRPPCGSRSQELNLGEGDVLHPSGLGQVLMIQPQYSFPKSPVICA